MGSALQDRKDFIARLKQACDLAPNLVAAENNGRQRDIANRLKVTNEAVSKWFRFEAMPSKDRRFALADWLHVDRNWLAFGTGESIRSDERRTEIRASSAAAMIVRGMVQMAGGAIGEPTEADKRSGYVDFYCVIAGRMLPVHVSLGREYQPGEFEFPVPKEYKDIRVVGVLMTNNQPQFFDLQTAIISEQKVRKAGDFALLARRQEGGKYFAGDDQLPRIKSFAELN